MSKYPFTVLYSKGLLKIYLITFLVRKSEILREKGRRHASVIYSLKSVLSCTYINSMPLITRHIIYFVICKHMTWSFVLQNLNLSK